MLGFRVSLATKCQLLFGAAVLLVVGAAMSILWWRSEAMLVEAQRNRARGLIEAYVSHPGNEVPGIVWVPMNMMEKEAARDPFIGRAIVGLSEAEPASDLDEVVKDADGRWRFRIARLTRDAGGRVTGMVVLEDEPRWAAHQGLLNRGYFIVAGLSAILLAIVSFWLITTRLILSPVRILRDTAAKVAEGDLNIRSVVHTGDEFEQMSETFNAMLASLKASQDKLRALNRQLDLKLGELAESNVTLHEANRLKGEFLANVSHELRTPLNSIIGFAEVLMETLGEGAGEKPLRYLQNIMASGRALLSMITELLDLAKIEAGRVELHIEPMSVADVCEVLLSLIQPQADRKKIQLKLAVSRKMETVTTDPSKFQQIIFNFLSNAVKFTPEGGRVELGAQEIVAEGAESAVTGLRVWVSDTGPGIPASQHSNVFEKFQQLDHGHTREHGGTGLGLAISLELARLLQGRIELDSEFGHGAKFTLVIPRELKPETPEALMPRHR